MQALAPWRDNLPTPIPFSPDRWTLARLLIEAGASVNVMTKAGVTPLMLVAEVDSPLSLPMVQTLLAANADVNGGGTATTTKMTPLSEGAQTFAYSRGGYTALGLAAAFGTVEVVQALLDANTQRSANPSLAVNAKQPGGNTPLSLASEKGRTDVVRLLLAAGAAATPAN
jgi:ankyrin repeat protein